jgi:uncharacterized protein YecE (DUF72 family)
LVAHHKAGVDVLDSPRRREAAIIADLTGKFVYARLQRGKDTISTAYPEKEIAAWAGRLRSWAQGKEPDDLPRVGAASPRKPASREVFAYVIHEGKVRAPVGAMALIARLANGE